MQEHNTDSLIYTRVTSAAQDSGDRPLTQTEACRQYADEHGMEVTSVYTETAESK